MMEKQSGKINMIDISDKPIQHRTATATGKISLKTSTIESIRAGEIKKGDSLIVGETAAMTAVKQTPMLLPMCHQIPITHIVFASQINDESIEVEVTVKTTAQTGVEMEALIGVSIYLNVIWDMTKYLEKDENGQYPTTMISEIIVKNKTKK